MVRLGQRRRDVAAQSLREMGNLVAAALVLGQFVSGQAISLGRLLAGLAIWLALATAAIMCTKEQADG
jgi:hypothetical protein